MNIDRLRIKIDRAKEQMGNLQSEIEAFHRTEPYKIETKRNPLTRQLIYYLSAAQPVPDRIAAVTGEIIQDLRSALDHLAYALWVIGTGSTFGTPAKHVYFPISDDANKYMVESGGRVKGMRKDAIDAINAVRPYQGGDDTLWLLHKLNNVDKHRFVILVGAAFRSMDIGAHVAASFRKAFPDRALPVLHAFFRPADRMFPLKQGDELFIDGPDADVNQQMQFRFEIAFGEPGILEGEPLTETLQNMVYRVDGLLTDFIPLLL